MTNEIFQSINSDIDKGLFTPGKIAVRKIIYNNGVIIIFSVDVGSRLKQLYIKVPVVSKITQFPKWNGVNIEYARLLEYDDPQNTYIRFSELPASESYIYEIVAENLRDNLSKLISESETKNEVIRVLNKWKNFFAMNGSLVLSDIAEQGLFGELIQLRSLISIIGIFAESYWSGYNKETHDFYLGDDGIEVKTTCTQEPYKAHINSEYQLDNNDIIGDLYLKFYALRRSKNSGQKLPEIVKEIRWLLADNIEHLDSFNMKIRKYGYYDETEAAYINGFFVRSERIYKIVDGFPRIIRDEIDSALADVEYEVVLSNCGKFLIDNDHFYKKIEVKHGQ